MRRMSGTFEWGTSNVNLRNWRAGDPTPGTILDTNNYKGLQPMWALVGPLAVITWKTGDVGKHGRFQWSEYCSVFDSCPLHEGGKCYYDGSGLAAEDMIELYARSGAEPVWAYLQKVYDDVVLDTLQSPLEWPEGPPTEPWLPRHLRDV